MRFLQYVTEMTLQPELAAFTVIRMVDQDTAFCRLIETAQEIDNG